MILLSSPGGSGINPFFPLLVTDRYSKISVIDWSQYRRLLPVFVAINIICGCTLAVIYPSPGSAIADWVYSASNIATFVYVMCRLRFGRRMITIDSRALRQTVAPFIVWADYLSLGAMFALQASVNLIRTDSEFMHLIFFGMKYFFLSYSLLPILNYAKYFTLRVE